MPLVSFLTRLVGALGRAITDTFNRANGSLGVTDTGETWEIISGTWQVSGNRAYTSTAASSEPKAMVDPRTPDVRITINLGTKDAVYLRYIDDNNWVRVVRGHYQTSSTAYCSYTNYSARGDFQSCSSCGGSCSPGGCGCGNSSPSCSSGFYCGNVGQPCDQWISCSCWCSADGTCTVACGTNYQDHHRYLVQQKVGGTLTTLFTSNTYATGASAFTITATGDALSVTDGRQASGGLAMSSALRDATKVGIGRVDQDTYDSSAIDNLVVTPL